MRFRAARKPPSGSALDSQDPDDEGFGTRVTGLEVSAKPESARTSTNDAENKTLAAMKEWLADSKRPKVVHDPKLFHLLAAPDSDDGAKAVAGIRHATILYSYLLRPTTSNHAFAEIVLRHMNRTLSGAPGERADFLLRLAPVLARRKWKSRAWRILYEKIDLPLALGPGPHGSRGYRRGFARAGKNLSEGAGRN